MTRRAFWQRFSKAGKSARKVFLALVRDYEFERARRDHS
jgi:hypothetical protein